MALSSGAVAVLAHLVFSAAVTVVYAIVRPPRPARLDGYRGVLAVLGGWAYWATRPILKVAVGLGLTPSGLTVVGLALNTAAGALAWQGAWGWAWVMLLWGCTGDLLDGELARSMGQSTKAGAFLDSNLDRVSEIALLGGLAMGLPGRASSIWALAALGASFMVSYARARGEGLGAACPTFGLERPHRMVIFIFTFLAAAFLPARAAELLLTVLRRGGRGRGRDRARPHGRHPPAPPPHRRAAPRRRPRARPPGLAQRPAGGAGLEGRPCACASSPRMTCRTTAA
jgi:CDP-diacylglycerol--glycerol-3-phosphate 3-phosphatidyltransferase